MTKLKELYNALRADEVPVPDTYDEFEGYLTSGPNHGYDHRKEVYEALRADGVPLPDTYDEFSNALFSPVKPESSANESPSTEQVAAPGDKQVAPINNQEASVQQHVKRQAPQLIHQYSSVTSDEMPNYFVRMNYNGQDFFLPGSDNLMKKSKFREWSANFDGMPVGIYLYNGNKPELVSLSEARERSHKDDYSIVGKVLSEDEIKKYNEEAAGSTSLQSRMELQQQLRSAEKELKALYGQREGALREGEKRRENETPSLWQMIINPSKYGISSSFSHGAGQIGRVPSQVSGAAQSELDKAIELKMAEVVSLGNAIREYDNKTKAAAKKQKGSPWYSDLWSGFVSGVKDPNSWTAGVLDASVNKAVRDANNTTAEGEQLLKTQEQIQQMRQELPEPGLMYSAGEFLGGMIADPTTPFMFGLGGMAESGAKNLLTKALTKGAAQKLGKEAGARYVANSFGRRFLIEGAGKAANFATFEGLMDVRQQAIDGGWTDRDGNFHEGFSWGEVAKSAGKGGMTGALMGVFGEGVGQLTDMTVSATGKGVATGFSAAAQTGERILGYGVGKLGEGTIFAADEIYEFQTMPDSKFDHLYAKKYGYDNETDSKKRAEARDAARNSLSWDAWDKSQLTIAMMNLYGVMSHPKSTIRSAAERINEIKGNDRRDHRSFAERVSAMMERSPRNIVITKEDREELQQAGYGDLADLFKSNDEPKPKNQAKAEEGIIDYPIAEVEEVGRSKDFDGYEAIQRLVEDGRVSEAIRAKLYYIVTGKMLPMSTITGYSTKNGDDGSLTINAVNAKGEVVTSRKFASADDAQPEIEKINRQVELNSIEVGERYANKAIDLVIMDEVKDLVGARHRLPGKAVENIYTKHFKGEKLSEAEMEIVKDVESFSEQISKKYQSLTPEAIREKIEEEFGVNVDEALRKPERDRNETESEAVQEYGTLLFQQAERQRKANAIFNEQYSEMRAEEKEKRRRAWRMQMEGKLLGFDPEIQAERDRSYFEGQKVYERFEQGDPTSQSDVDAIGQRLKDAYQDIEDVFGADAEYYLFRIGENPWDVVNDPGLSEERRDAILNYMNAKSALDGVMDASNEAADRKRDEIKNSVERRTHKDSGVIIPATMEGEDREVYVVKGNIVMQPDGSGVDVNNSSESIIVLNTETGEYEFASPEQISRISDGVDPQEELEAAMLAIEQEQMSLFGQPDVAPEEGSAEETGTNGDENNPDNGNIEGANIPADTGQYDRGYEEGTASTDYNDEELSRAIESGRSALNEGKLDDFGRGRLEGLEYEQQRRAMEAQGETDEPILEGENRIQQQTAGDIASEGRDSILSRIPVNEQGEPMFESVDKDMAWDGLVEAVGAESDAADIAMAQVQQATADLETLKRKPPTPKAPKLKGSPMDMIKAKQDAKDLYQEELKKYNQQVADMQARLDAWNGIVGVYTSRNAELRRQQEEARRQRDAEAHDAAVAQFEEQQRIKAEKKAEQELVGVHAVNPKIKEKWDNAPKIEGNPDALTLPDGSSIRGRYVLTEAGSASASHDVNNAYQPTEGFPIDENGQSVNDRDYHRDKDAQRIVEQMAGAYDNRALQNPIIVSQDGVVLSGNNRTMSGDLAARQGTDKAYVDYLREFGQKYGFTPEQVAGMNNPRLVFVPDEALPYDATTFSRFNAQEMKSQSKPEAAVKLGKIVPDNVFNNIVSDISRYDRLADYYADEKAVSHALGSLMHSGVINDKQMPEMRTGTALSAAGKELLENTLIGKVFQASPDAVRQIISMPTLRQSIVMGLNEIANNRTLARNGYDLSEELSKAVDLVTRSKAAMPDVYTDGMPVSPFGRMQGLFDDEYGDSRVTDATTLLLADLLNSGKPSELRKVLATYNNEATQAASGQADIFTGEVPTKENILTEIVNQFNNGTAKEKQELVDAAIAGRKQRAAGIQERGGSAAMEQTADAGSSGEERKKRVGGNTEEIRQVNVGRGGDGYDAPRKDIVEGTGIKTSESETDDNDIPLMISSNGTTTFGEIGKNEGIKPGPIKMSLGFDIVDENGKHYGYGYNHIEGQRGDVIREAGFASVGEFVEFVSKNKTTIKEGNVRKNGKKTYIIEIIDNRLNDEEHTHILYIELASNGDYWHVNSGGIMRPAYTKGKKEIQKEESSDSLPAIETSPATADEEVQKQGGISMSGNSPSEDSEGKDNTLSSEKQGNGGESLRKAVESISHNEKVTPTPAQAAAGNYKMEHRRIDGYNISIENPKGSVRRGKDADGKEWQTEMHHDYGYIRGTKGVDGDHIDVFLSDTPEEGDVFVIDQRNEDGSFDEHKVMYGFPSEEAAREAYLSNYGQGWTGLGAITHVSKDEFKKWVQSSKRKTKPFSEYKSVQVHKELHPQLAIEPDGFNDFGPVFTQFKGNAPGAIKVLLELQDGEATDALHHKDIGDIDLVWGKAGTGNSDGFGLAKLVKYHPEVVEHLQEILDDMHIVKRTENRINLESYTHKAAVRLTWNKKKKKWLLTAFEKKETPKSIDKTTDTGDNPTDLQDDTALSQNSGVSAGKDNTLSSEKQGNGEESSNNFTITPSTYTRQKWKGGLEEWFGPINTELAGKGKEAEAFLRKQCEGVVKGALRYPGLSPIDLAWGDKNAGYMKIVAKHPEVVGHLQEILDNCEISRQSDNRVVLENDTHKIIVSKMKGQTPTDNWLLTAYEKKKKSVSASSSDIETEPEGKRTGTATPQNELSEGKDNALLSEKQGKDAESFDNLAVAEAQGLEKKGEAGATVPYTITPSSYTNKAGKTTPMHSVRFFTPLTYEQRKGLAAFAREKVDGRKSRGWCSDKDTYSEWLFRSEEDARKAGEMIADQSGETVADALPMTAEELRDAVSPASPKDKPAKKAKKAPINRVSLEDVMTDLSTKGESQLSDHAEPVKAEKEVQHEISDDEMQSLVNELRDLLGIGEDEGDRSIRFRDPGELTPQERMRIQSAGIRLAMGLVERGTTSFPDYATKMVGLMGDKIRPWLKSFYEGARWTPGYENIAFTPSEEVARFDVQNFDKVQANPIEQAAMIVEERKASTASAQAQKELTEIRNNKRKKQDEQTSADTAALTSKAEAIARKAESLAETSEDTAELNRAGEEIDQTIEEINDQLALIGYYEADFDSPEHEVYGHLRSAEKKAVADATKLAKQLVNDLGIDIKVTSATTPLGRKSVKKGTAVRANLAPTGGDVMINLPLNEGRQLSIYIGLEPVAEKGTRRRGDNLAVERILYRVENPSGKGMERYGHNMYAPVESTYSDFLRRIKEITRDYLPKQETPKTEQSFPDSKDTEAVSKWLDENSEAIWKGVDAIMVDARQDENLLNTYRADNPADVREPVIGEYIDKWLGDRIGDMETSNPIFNAWFDYGQRGLIGSVVDERMAKVVADEAAKAKAEESHNGYKRGDEVLWDRYGNGKWEKQRIVDFENDGRPIFDSMGMGVMMEIGDWSRVKPADGIFGEAKRVATKSQADRKKAETPSTSNPDEATEKVVEVLTGGKKPAKKKTAVKPEQPVANLFGGLFVEPISDEKRNGNKPCQEVAGGERIHTVGTDETGTDGRVPAAGTEPTDKGGAADEASAGVERGADSATHGTHADGGLQSLLGNRGRDESNADRRSAGAAVERDGATGAGSVSKRGTDRGAEELSEREPASASGGGGGTTSIKKQKKPEVRYTRNFRYDEKAGNEADSYTPSERLEANVKAIETLAEVLFGDKPATEEQRAIMSRFRGWGQVDLGKYYDIDHILRNIYGNTPINRLAKVIQKLDPQGEKKLFDSIKRASLSSYYTPTPIARAMNTFLSLAGYKGGALLDPSMGNGIYEGTLPKSIQERTAITGVELDWISGQLSRMLYPDANVMIGGFEKSGIAPGSFDVVTSNVPFGDIVVNDPTWKNDATPLKRSAQNRIHNYYAVKMLEAARPGGLVAMLTTSAVLDTPSNQNIRAHIADQGEILGAIRLPDNTFQGTGVVTDILFIRKWRDDQDRAQTREDASYMDLENAFLSHYEATAPNKLDGKEEKVRINGYFEKNPRNLIGEMQAGNQYGKRDAFGLTSKLSVEEIASEIDKAVKRIVGTRRGSLFNPSRTIRESQQAIREAYKGDGDWVSNGNLVVQDGKVGVLTAKSNEYGEITRTFEGTLKHDKMLPKIKAMIGLRTAMKKLITGQIEGMKDATLKTLRGELQEAYDNFVGKYGRLQDKENAFILDDIDGYTLQALETWKSGKFVGLSDIFTKNSIKPALKLDGKKTPQEAVALSLAEYGYLRPDYMVKALGEDWAEQCGDFVFLKPNSVDDYVTRDEYLSGDVVTKLAEARAAAEKDDTFTRNVKALEEVQPARIPFDDIAIHLGARWIPENVLNDFVNDLFGIHAVRSSRNGHWDPEKREYVYNQKSGVRYIPETDSFEINIEKKELGGAASDWETPKKSAKDILQAAIEDKTLLIKYKDKEGNEHIDEEQTELVNQKIADLRERFESWLPSDPGRVDLLEQAYNDRFNRTVIRHFDGSHLVVPGLMGKELRPHQKDAVWMLINNRGGIVDHIVGAGKTLVMQSAIMEMRRMGIAKKPMIVALKSTVAQIAREFKEAFPSARVLAPNDSDFKKENRKKFIANISLNDYDCVILSHEQYCMLPHTEEAERAVIDEQMWQLDNMIEYLYGTNDSSQMTKKQIKALEKRRENLKARLEKRLDRNVDREFCFENLGIDYMFVDESHQFKSLPYVTSYQKVAGLGDTKGSSRAVALLTGIRHLQRMHQGDKGTVFLSGTTITNSLVEIYNLLNYLRPRKLEELGMPTFDAWASVFAVHSAELEAGVTGNFAMKDRFRSFDNVPELSQLYSEIADVRNDTNLKLPKPAVDGRTVIVPASESMQEINSEIVNMLESKNGSYFDIYPKDPNRAPWGLHASTLSAKAAVSPRLIFPDMEDDGGKVHAVCENVKKFYDEQADQLGVQLIFCEMGVPDKSKKYDAYTDMVNRFVNDYGIPRSEIAYIQEANTEEKRKDLFQRVRDGKVRILIGGTKNMGTGVNVQDRITDMHILTVPWTPSALEQCIGRGARQGNLVARDFMDNKVRVHYYATEGSLDLYKYQLLDAKGKMFTQFKMGTVNGGRSFDEGSADEGGNIDPAEMVAILSGNPVIFERAKQEKVVKKLRALRNGFERDYQRKKAKHDELQRRKENFERLIRLNDRDRAELEREGFHSDDKGIYPTTVTITEGYSRYGGRTFNKPKEAGEYLLKMLEEGKNVILQGFGQRAQVVTVNEEGSGGLFSAHRELQIGTGEDDIKYTVRLSDDATAAGTAFRNLLKRIVDNGALYRHELEETQNQLAGMHIGDGVFSRQAELDEAVAKLRELNAEYNKLGKKSDSQDDKKYRDGEEMTDGERLRAIRALEPIVAQPNNLSRAELFTEYRSLPAVKKNGAEIRFLRGMFGKIYRPGSLFAQAVPVLNDILEHSVLAYSEADELGGIDMPDGTIHKWHPNVDTYDNYVGKMSVNGKDYYVRLTVQNTKDSTTGDHSCFVSNVDLYEKTASEGTDTTIFDRPNQTESGIQSTDVLTVPNFPSAENRSDGIVDAKLQQFFERARAEAEKMDMRERVEGLSEKLNTPVRIIEDVETPGDTPLSRRERRAKGWWSSQTDEVVVVLPNNINVADVENTVVHEVVGHKGLRALISPERFDDFLGEVYSHAYDSIKKKIDAATDRMVASETERLVQAEIADKPIAQAGFFRAAYTAKAKRQAERKREHFRKEATEEYMADLGGRIGEEGFEKMSQDELTFWGKIKAKVQQFLDKFLQGLKIAKSIRLNDKDLSYILYKSWKNLRDKRGKGSIFAEAEDVVRRRQAGYDDMMTVSEKYARIEKLRKSSPVEISGKEIEYNPDIKGFKKNALEYGKKLQGKYINEDTGKTIHLQRGRHNGGLKEDLQHDITEKAHIQSIAAIPAIITNSIYIETSPNMDVAKNPDVTWYEHYVCGLRIGEEDYTVHSIVASDKDGNRYYDHKLSHIEKGKLLDFIEAKQPIEQILTPMSGTEPTIRSQRKVKELISLLQVEDEGMSKRFRDPGMGLEETITRMKAEAMQANTDNLQAKRDAMRAIGGNLNHLRQAMARQREYDITTAKSIKDLARVLMQKGLLDDLGNSQVVSLLSQITNAIGRKDISKQADRVFDIMVDNHHRNMEKEFGKLISIRTSRADGRGIKVQGALDPEGEAILKVFNSWKNLPTETYDAQGNLMQGCIMSRIQSAIDAMSDPYAPIAERATLEYAGLQIAQEYSENISNSKQSEKMLREEIKKAKEEKEARRMTSEAYHQFEDATRATIRQMKLDRIAAYESLMDKLGGELKESVERAKAWRESEKERVNTIHHLANSDMEGRELRGDREDTRLMKLRNHWLVNWLLEPMSTLDQMLKMFGSKNPNGEGYMQNYFMRAWINAADKEQEMKETFHKKMDDKAAEIFGKHRVWYNGGLKKVDYTYSDLYDYVKALPKAAITYYDGAEMREYEIGQGDLLYLYAVEKMPMGRATNRRMSIDDATIQRITEVLDPKLKEYADWSQEELHPQMGVLANEVHKLMFGADMDAIENYFPFVRDKNALKREVENGQTTHSNDRISVQTGAIKTRVASVAKWDMKRCNFLDVQAKHVDVLCHWIAFAPLNRDLGTLLSHNRLKQQVFSMNSVYGAGEQLWKRFQECCAIATDAYDPQRAKFDRFAVQGTKGATMGKISLRTFTALKQTLSLPAFFGEVNMKYVAADLGTGGVKACQWAWKNMPNFRKRILSRTSGDYRLKENEYDGKIMKAASYGMLPNIGVDAWTIAVGSHGVYKTRKAKYLRWGMDENQAERRAVQDAELCYNKSQQSSEGPFMAPVQVDHTFYATSAMLFRNSSTSYTREAYTSARNLKRLISGEVKEEFVTKQILRTIGVKTYNQRFDEELGQQVKGELAAGHIYALGKPGGILQSAGFPDMPIEMAASRLAAKAVQGNHIFPIEAVKGLVNALNNPVAVFRYGNNAMNVIVGLSYGGKQFLVGVHFNQQHRGTEVSDIRGLFPKDNAEWLNWISQGKATYLNHKKIQALIAQQRINLAEVGYLNLEDVAKVMNNFHNPHIPDQKNDNSWSEEDWKRAKSLAKREIRSAYVKNTVNLAMFGWILPWLWRIGSIAPLLLLSGDDEEKQKQWEDATRQSMFAPVEGLAYGDVIVEGLNYLLPKVPNKKLYQLGRENPIFTDIKDALKNADKDLLVAANDVINIIGSMAFGINPQTVTDWTAAIIDATDDRDTQREMALFACRLLSVPQSQIEKIYFEELDMDALEASRRTPDELMQRYARYKMLREAPLTGWLRNKEERNAIAERKSGRVRTAAKDRLSRQTDALVSTDISKWMDEYKRTKDRVSEIGKMKSKDEDRYDELRDNLEATPEYERYLIIKDYKREVDALTKEWLRASTPAETDSCVKAIITLKREMVEDLMKAQ